MDLTALRRAFRARPGTAQCTELGAFLQGLATCEPDWQSLVSILEMDVIPVVQRYHPTTESDEISSTCLIGAFENWVAEWLECRHAVCARSFFIARTRERIHEAERKQRRQALLMTRHCSDALEGRISALPPAHLLGQDLAHRLRRMLGAVDELGPEHSRVFDLLLEGHSQCAIAKAEGRDPAAISRRVRNLRELCREQLLE